MTAAQTTGTISELVTSPNTASYDYLVGTKTLRHTPTVNVTVNLTPKNRLQGSYYYQYYMDTPDSLNSVESRFPGFPGDLGLDPDRTVQVGAAELQGRAPPGGADWRR